MIAVFSRFLSCAALITITALKKHLLTLAASCLCLLGAADAITATGREPQPSTSPDSTSSRAVLDRYCVTCHSERTHSGGLTLAGLDLAHPEAQPATWEAVVRKLRTRTMPPPGMPRPDESTYATMTSWLTAELDRAAAVPNPGRPLLRRLN